MNNNSEVNMHYYDPSCFCKNCCANEKRLSNIAKNDKLLEDEELRRRGLNKPPDFNPEYGRP